MSILLKVITYETKVGDLPDILNEIGSIEMIDGKKYDLMINGENLKFILKTVN